MQKFSVSPFIAAAAQRQRMAARDAARVLYAPAPDDRAHDAALHEIEKRELMADAMGITIGDEDDDDFY